MMHRLHVLCLVLPILVACSADSGPPEPVSQPIAANAGALTEALAAAQPGDVLRVAGGTITGSFVVPAGVSLEGADGGATLIEGDGLESVLLTEVASGQTSSISQIRVRSNGSAGIVARGGGAVRISDVRVESVTGVAIAAVDLASLELANVELVGPVTADNVRGLPVAPSSADVATHGLVTARVGAFTGTGVDVSGFAVFGALLVDTDVTWVGGELASNLGTGIMVFAGAADLTDVRVGAMLPAQGLMPSYGVVVSEGELSTSGLNLSDNAGVGLLQNQSVGTHVDVVASGNDDTSLWVQDSDQFELSGAGSLVTDGRFAGVVVAASTGVMVSDVVIEGTRTAPALGDDGNSVMVGDGIQFLRTSQGIQLENVTLSGNARVGALFELGGTEATNLSIQALEVNGTGTQLGVVGQNGTLPMGWDSDVTRLGATEQNDLDFVTSGGSLGVTNIVGPSDIPAPSDLQAGGLDVLGVVTPSD